MTISVEEFCRNQRFLGGPSWRWQTAKLLAGESSRRTTKVVDRYIMDAKRYLIERSRGREKEVMGMELAQIGEAELLTKEFSISDSLKVLVLGNCDREEIAKRFEIDTGVIATWEMLFFDARQALGASDWILSRVIRPEQEGGNTELAAKLKCAYAGGAVAAKAVLDCDAGKVCHQGERLFEQRFQLNLKTSQALEMPLQTNRERARFMKMRMDLWRLEQRFDLERQRLEHRSRELLYQQTAAEARLEHARHRQQKRAEAVAEGKRQRAMREEEREIRRQGAEMAQTLKEQEEARIAQECLAASALAQLTWESARKPPEQILPFAS